MNQFAEKFSKAKRKPAVELPEFLSGLDLFTRPETSMPYLVEGLIPKVGFSFFTGSSDIGKSAFLRQLAVYIVQRQERFCGFNLLPVHGRVLFIASEDDEFNTPGLIKKLTDDPKDLENLIFSFDSEDLYQTISSVSDLDLVIVDCSLDFMGKANMNQANEVRSWLKPLHDLAKKNEFQIIFLTHNSKRSEEREPNKANVLGSQSFEAKARLVLELRRGDEPNQRWLCILKANFLSDEEKAEAHELKMESMRFVSTGMRKPLTQIVKRSTERSTEQRVETVQTLHAQGLSQRKIAKQTGISLGAVNSYVKGVQCSTP